MNTPALLTLSDIRTPSVSGPQFQLEHWQLRRGEKWLVSGGNGAGKSRFANIITQAQAISRGKREYAHNFDCQRDVCFVSFEYQHLLYAHDNRYDDSTLREDLNDRGTLVRDLLQHKQSDWWTQLGIMSLLDRGVRTLSTGEMRKVLLLRALGTQCTLLILDDPLAGIDATSAAQLRPLIERLLREAPAALLLSSTLEHWPSAITHVLVLQRSEVVGQGPVSESLLEKASHRLSQKIPMQDSLPGEAQHLPDGEHILIRMRDVFAAYNDKTLFEKLNWDFRRGQHARLAGPNGCGKTTLLGMINGENTLAYGQDISLFGRKKGSGESIWELKQLFGTVSTAQHSQYVRGFNAQQVVLSGLHDSIGLYRRASAADSSLAEQWLGLIGLQDCATQPFRQLSYGQQRLILLARAMIKRPAILVLDEPCIGLDADNTALVLGLLSRIVQQSATQILYVSHIDSEVPGFINQQLQFIANGEARALGASRYRIQIREISEISERA